MSSTFLPSIRAVPAAGRWATAAIARRRGLRTVIFGFAAVWALVEPSLPSPAAAQQAPPLVVRPLAEKRLAELPPGSLFWRVETFPSVAEARAAEGPTALVAEAAGRVWLFTLAPAGGASPGGAKAAEVGPIPEIRAPQYLLRINQASGPPGSVTPVHTHPGSEAFYVLAGETSQRTPHGVAHVGAGQAMAGHGAGVPMQVSSSGSTDLLSLVMLVVDATKPFSSTASIQ
jgi:quercetin dioxygenase-like cupin family protein